MSLDIEDRKRAFLHSEILKMTINGALATRDEKNPVYRGDPSDKEKTTLKRRLKALLSELRGPYERGEVATEEAHCKNIQSLAERLTNEFPSILKDGKFRIGIAQKALNLYLKYLWTLGWIDEPPHCPFDSEIIDKLEDVSLKRWTSLDSIDDYIELVVEAQSNTKAYDGSVAIWELMNWRGIE